MVCGFGCGLRETEGGNEFTQDAPGSDADIVRDFVELQTPFALNALNPLKP